VAINHSWKAGWPNRENPSENLAISAIVLAAKAVGICMGD
jgi:hypothetical protein